jgi:CRISPR-associated endonuclease/helicase Cas3
VQQIGLLVRFLFSCLIDADRVDTANFEHRNHKKFRSTGRRVDWPSLIDRLERHLLAFPARHPIDELRQDISRHCHQAAGRPAGIYTLTVPTGGGKTLASLRFALHHAARRELDRIIYVIPFTSIIDQNAQVVRSILEPADVPKDRGRIVLEHHGSVTPEQQTWREKVLCENWDAPVVYTTMVQFLEALFGAGTRGARRMHQLARAVLIFDEVQTLPIKCVHMFNNAVNFLAMHCDSTVLLCTATQPLLHKVAKDKGAVRLASEHELMPDVHDLFERLKRVTVCDARKPGGWTDQEIADLALAEVQRSGSCLVIVNTKAAARRIFELCAKPSESDGDAVCHLSTDMCPAHRKQELAKLRARLAAGQAMLCVSTQLIEAGVDVDFGTVIRFMAGLDSIAQAAGRCNRNGRPEPGIVHIVNPQDESLDKLPDILKGRDAAYRVLDEYRQEPAKYQDNLVGPQALSAYYGYYFFDRKGDMAYPVSAGEVAQADTLLNLLSRNDGAVAEFAAHHETAPDIFFRQAFMTAAKAFKAIDAPTQAVIVPFGEAGRSLVADLFAAYDVEQEFKLLRAAQQFTVNVFPHVLRKLKDAGALREVKPDARILCLDGRYYSALFGLATEPVSLMETLND